MLRSDKKERTAASAVSATIASIAAFALIATCAIPGFAQAYAEQSTTLPNCQDPAWCSEAPSGTAEPARCLAARAALGTLASTMWSLASLFKRGWHACCTATAIMPIALSTKV